ncbi:hypothetical protein [Armatimonas sp.]|uniref:hypothetical protein n=1 Tax=Armatimonas sp. TaxID=1872638 RepID=UPI00286B5008|nr:hypothetical protein [Armatimonas sp.]
MKIKFLGVCMLALLAVAGCSKPEPTVIDQNAAKTQPGADTPPAVPNPAATAALRAEKEGK